jgi:hypothetical protein
MSDQPVAPSSVAAAGRPVPRTILDRIAKYVVMLQTCANRRGTCESCDDSLDRISDLLEEAAVGSRLPPPREEIQVGPIRKRLARGQYRTLPPETIEGDIAYLLSLVGGSRLPGPPLQEEPNTLDRPWWCATCESWRHTMPCGRDDCPKPSDQPPREHTLNAMRELCEEMARAVEYMTQEQRDDLLPDWFAPRLIAVLAGGSTRTDPGGAQDQ